MRQEYCNHNVCMPIKVSIQYGFFSQGEYKRLTCSYMRLKAKIETKRYKLYVQWIKKKTISTSV